MIFLEHMLKAFPFKVDCVQTDNGCEFTKRLQKENDLTLFEEKLKELGIIHKLIKPYTPRHNGKVERSHRKDKSPPSLLSCSRSQACASRFVLNPRF